jgi:3-dehydroquinate synthase
VSTFNVELKRVVDDSYEIEIGRSLAGRLADDLRAGLIPGRRRFALITDSTVESLFAPDIRDRLLSAGFEGEIFSFPAGEPSKTRETKSALEDRMLAAGYRRDCFVLAVGGGVVSDLAGFLAGTYARGVPFINYATTLLAAADASVGGKTAVDTPLATNLIGLFHQPRKVYIDIDAWRTLPPRQISSGLAETVKHALLAETLRPAGRSDLSGRSDLPGPAAPADRAFFEYLEEHMEAIRNHDPSACEWIARQNCSVKYQVVMKDERETGLREILNLGHTVGRAVETESAYRLTHGEAVSIGLAAACALSVRLDYMTEQEAARVRRLLARAGLPAGIPAYVDREALLRRLYTDKKVRNGRLRFVLPQGIGAVVEFSPGVFAREISEETAREILLALPEENP